VQIVAAALCGDYMIGCRYQVANASRFFESDGSGFHSQAGYAFG